ncbi:MAG: SpoVR family protein [Hyphomicrobiaceae bacterium]
MGKAGKSLKPLYEGSEWTFKDVQRVYDAIAEVGYGELGLDIYTNQIEVITAEQMLDAYASIGLPLMYRHWSFGKRFAREELLYRKGVQALAYELVINSNPSVCYIMEENTMTMQALVLAHAAFGHNHFFKNNYLFQQWTDADTVLDYMAYAKRFIADCEERHGLDAVETVLDAAHALMRNGVSRYAPSRTQRAKDVKAKARKRREYEEATFNDLWRTVPGETQKGRRKKRDAEMLDRAALGIPEENLLLFLERYAPKLEDWQRELIRIVRNTAQYFYPQRQTKVMNEGCATFVHYEIMNRLYDKGQITEGAMLEFLHMHSAVIAQPGFEERRFSGLNPYALGFAMMRDIQQICEKPTAEDKEWFPEIAGTADPLETLRSAWSDFRDESFILQYLSPRLIRNLRMFSISDDTDDPFMFVTAIHKEDGYIAIRDKLARQYDLAHQDPDIQVTDANLKGNRRLVLTHRARDGQLLEKEECNRTLRHVAQLWGYRVRLIEVDAETDRSLNEYDALPMP